MEVVMTTGATNRAKLQSNHHHKQTNTQHFTGRMPFLSPNQQCQSTEGKISHSIDLLTQAHPGLPTLFLTTNSSWIPWGGFPCLSSALWCQYPKRTERLASTICLLCNWMQMYSKVQETHAVYFVFLEHTGTAAVPLVDFETHVQYEHIAWLQSRLGCWNLHTHVTVNLLTASFHINLQNNQILVGLLIDTVISSSEMVRSDWLQSSHVIHSISKSSWIFYGFWVWTTLYCVTCLDRSDRGYSPELVRHPCLRHLWFQLSCR